ncbi:hypothetical protein M3Y99_00086200 [Aphelenchoides fujianensis]|nr:hypothetical protein M3Y99_00086200 [Aphelenchoides fujianensis]
MGRKSLALLCEAILEDHFGFYVAAVGRVLLKGACTFRELHKQLHATCKGIDIKKALCTLEVHGLVTFSAGNRGPVYAIQPAVCVDKILNEHNPQRELSDQGRESARPFTNLVKAEALIKADFVVAGENEEVPVLTPHEHPLAFKPPEAPVPTEENPQKRKLPAESPDELWIANWTGLQKLLRDEAVLECIQGPSRVQAPARGLVAHSS